MHPAAIFFAILVSYERSILQNPSGFLSTVLVQFNHWYYFNFTFGEQSYGNMHGVISQTLFIFTSRYSGINHWGKSCFMKTCSHWSKTKMWICFGTYFMTIKNFYFTLRTLLIKKETWINCIISLMTEFEIESCRCIYENNGILSHYIIGS